MEIAPTAVKSVSLPSQDCGAAAFSCDPVEPPYSRMHGGWSNLTMRELSTHHHERFLKATQFPEKDRARAPNVDIASRSLVRQLRNEARSRRRQRLPPRP